MANDVIRTAIDAFLTKVLDKLEVTNERILAEMAAIAFSDMRKIVKWGADMRAIHNADGQIIGYTSGVGVIGSDEIDDQTAAAISEVAETKDGIRIKLHDKKDALRLLGNDRGLFKDTRGTKDNPIKLMVQQVVSLARALPIGQVQPTAPAALQASRRPMRSQRAIAAPEAAQGISRLLRPQGDQS